MTRIVKSDDFSNHNLPIGARVEFLRWRDDDDVCLYTQGGDGDEVAIDRRDLEGVPVVDGWVCPPVGHVFWPKEGVACTVIGEPDPTIDLFGRGMRNVLIRINDTGEEGWYTYGPQAIIFDIEER